jgi:hypothetical protein
MRPPLPFPAIVLAVLLALPWPRTAAGGPSFSMPVFPLPVLVRDQFGQAKRIGFLTFLRALNAGGVRSVDDVDFLDSDYAMIESSSLPLLAAWLEATCASVGLNLPEARLGAYDGSVAARLMGIGATLAGVRAKATGLAMPIGLVICARGNKWGSLPDDRSRDAYALIATEKGLMVYDPPTRQLVGLADFPNTAEILNIQF